MTNDYSIAMKAEFAEANSAEQQQQIVNNFVRELRLSGFSDEKIIEIGNIEYLAEEQSSKIMISNTQKFKDAMKKALGTK